MERYFFLEASSTYVFVNFSAGMFFSCNLLNILHFIPNRMYLQPLSMAIFLYCTGGYGFLFNATRGVVAVRPEHIGFFIFCIN